MAQRVRVTRTPGIALKIMSDVVPNEWALDTRRPTSARKSFAHTYGMRDGFVTTVRTGDTLTSHTARPVNVTTTDPNTLVSRVPSVVRSNGTTPVIENVWVNSDGVRVRTMADDADKPLPYHRPATVHAPATGPTRREKSARTAPTTDPDGRERDATGRRGTSNADIDAMIRAVYDYHGPIDARMRSLARDAIATAAATARYTA